MSDIVIFGQKEAKWLYSSYGTLDLFNSGAFNPLTRNLTTGAIGHKTHHCPECDSMRTHRCFKWPNPHLAFCSEYVWREGKRERCGEVYALKSDGCGTHTKVQGYNATFNMAFRGFQVKLSDFRDPEAPKKSPQQEQGNKNIGASKQRSLDTFLEDVAAELDFIPSYATETFFDLWNEQEDYARQQEKENAARSIQVPISDTQAPSTIFTTAAKGKRSAQMTAKQIKKQTKQTKREEALVKARTYAPIHGLPNIFKKTRQANIVAPVAQKVAQKAILKPAEIVIKAVQVVKARYERTGEE